jgi:hypothetical protein
MTTDPPPLTNPPASSARLPFWTRDSFVLLGGFLLVITLVTYFWWPLAAGVIRGINRNGQWWLHLDWLLIGIFLFTSFAIVARANLKTDALMIFVGLCGGLMIEAWGTQTNLWHYYTSERPPLWIIPAWPIANLATDRITRTLDFFIKKFSKGRSHDKAFKIAYWAIFSSFMFLMVSFIAPTLDKSFTVFSLLLCTAIMSTPTNHRRTVLTFAAGTTLGYFLELWGTTNHCWTYYTRETPPLFAVLAHGMASVAFWRAGLTLKMIWNRLQTARQITKQKRDPLIEI